MWDVTPTALHDWSALKAKVSKFGVRNSLLLAPMPTASTAQILGNNEGIEAYTSNIYTRRVLSGEFQVKSFFPFYLKKCICLLNVKSFIEPSRRSAFLHTLWTAFFRVLYRYVLKYLIVNRELSPRVIRIFKLYAHRSFSLMRAYTF